MMQLRVLVKISPDCRQDPDFDPSIDLNQAYHYRSMFDSYFRKKFPEGTGNM